MSMSIGSSTGFSAVAIPQLTDEGSFKGDDFSWFGILFNLFILNTILVTHCNLTFNSILIVILKSQFNTINILQQAFHWQQWPFAVYSVAFWVSKWEEKG